jgi:hypothetical protein
MKNNSLLNLKSSSRFFLAALFLAPFANLQAEDVVKTDAILQDAFVNQQPAQVDAVQGAGTLYLKNQADGIRNTYIRLSVAYLDEITATQVDETAVKLRLYVFRGNTNLDNQAIDVCAVTADWDETTLTWNNAPETAGTPVASAQVPEGIRASITAITGATSGQQGALDNPFSAAQYIHIDITEYAIAQYKAGNKTFSIALKYPAVENNGDTQIVSKDADVAGLGEGGSAKLPALVFGEKPIVIPTETRDLIRGGSMETADAVEWSEYNFNSTNILAAWGATEGAPTAGEGGALHIVGTSPANNSYAVYQTVELEAGVEYSTDAAYSVIGQKNTAWVEMYIGNVSPTTLEDYTGTNCGGIQIASLFNWSNQPSVVDGTFSANANSKPKKFVPTASGTYYFLIKFGANGSDGHFDVLIDNVSFTYEAPVVSNLQAVDKGNNRVYAEAGQIRVESESVIGNAVIYHISGAWIESRRVSATQFASGNLLPGIYIVLVDGVARKVAVK